MLYYQHNLWYQLLLVLQCMNLLLHTDAGTEELLVFQLYCRHIAIAIAELGECRLLCCCQ